MNGVLGLPRDRYKQIEHIENNFCDNRLPFNVEDFVIERHGNYRK